ncbi:helix-turn-helix domain-containing protein [Sellimonas caecigallum]|uniref:helix-turn-helix domain-containing protein n=1 Tax=Sellimonas caecigallum TaxID=2592333 RepID=UPI00386F7B27
MHGIDAFICGPGNASYTSEFKTMCVEEVLSGYGSSMNTGAKYKVYPSVLGSWIKMYNANRELKDYDPKREVYMAEARRKTTIEERKKIVTYCIEHNRDYKGTAALYDVSYSQVYFWVKKYDTAGKTGLTDRRGRLKTDDEVVELLKKVKEFEGM